MRSDALTVLLPSKLVRYRPDDMVNAIQPWKQEDNTRLTNFVSSPHFAGTGLYMIHRYAGKLPDCIDVERLRVRTNNIPRLHVEVPE